MKVGASDRACVYRGLTLAAARRVMERCAAVAREGLAAGEMPTAALLYDPLQRCILASSANCVERDNQPLDHAECVVLRGAGLMLGHRNFQQLILFSLLEPCQFCTEACSLYRLGGCVFGAYNRGKAYASPPDWIGGVGESWFEEMVGRVGWRRG